MEEIWKPIPNFSKYHASNFGRIKTFNWKGSKKEAVMKPAKSPDGYWKTVLIDDMGNYKTITLHRMIATTFIPNPENKPQINHKDGNKDNNVSSNLEWVTFAENISHAVFNNMMVPHYGEENGMAKVTESIVRDIRSKFKRGVYGRKKLADEYGLKEHHIKDIVLKRTWKHLL